MVRLMNEVKKYHWNPDSLDGYGYGCMYEMADASSIALVAQEDFDDSQRLRADTAEAALDNYIKQAVLDTAHRQGLLAAAEQRIADLDSKLARALELLRGVHTGDLFGPDDWEMVNAFLSDAALNPNPEAESHE